jgi:hypothetical protein
MKYTPNLTPKHYYEILEKSKKINFEMYSQEDLGLLLRFLTVSKKIQRYWSWVLEQVYLSAGSLKHWVKKEA